LFSRLRATAPFSDHPHTRIHGLAAHYYCGTAGASATEYSADQWYELLEKASRMEELIIAQRRVMDEFDPGRAVGLVVDEWGTWHPPTPGRHPSHLWQQNTLRDALVAAITLDTFHRHADQVVMANIAQMVNVLQAMVLTEGERMTTTPTYHVFDLYRRHQGATAVRMDVEARQVSFAVGAERRTLGGLSGSASMKEGELILSVVNPHASLPVEAEIVVRGGRVRREAEVGLIVDGDLKAHNTVEEPQRVRAALGREAIVSGEWRHTFPPASVTILSARLGA
jgi:alpha-N-arabinofuranosidase